MWGGNVAFQVWLVQVCNFLKCMHPILKYTIFRPSNVFLICIIWYIYRYKASSKCSCVLQDWKIKENAIWSAVVADQSFGFHPTWDQTSVGILTQSMITSIENEWDIVPAGRKKFIHYIGAACKFTLNIANSPFTGVFKNGIQHGLLRMGSATWVDPFPLHGCVPGVSIKFFRSYR